MTSVAVIGANGFVGGALSAALGRRPDTAVARVVRANFDEMREKPFDVLINAAMPAARFWAKNNPREDFRETVTKTADLYYGWNFKKFVQISTVSARCQLDTVYGRHKAAAERVCAAGDTLTVRLGPLYGEGAKKGVLIDMLNNRTVYTDGDSRYCFAPVEFVAEWIAGRLDRTGVVEVGARNALTLREVARHLGADVEFEGALDHQEIADPGEDFPDARDVLGFLDGMKRHAESEA